jgi:hypothetical protein
VEKPVAYWVKRIGLRSGEIVTERELTEDENRFAGQAPVVGEKLMVTCRGRTFEAIVVWGNWPGRTHEEETVVPLRVVEI